MEKTVFIPKCVVQEFELRENKKFFEAVREESYEIPPDRLEQMDEDPEYWEKYSWNNLFYYRSLSPSRHFRYHALISVIWMFLGVLILASKTFHLISIEPIACGFLLLCCSIFAFSLKSPKATIIVSVLGAVLSILISCLVGLVFTVEHYKVVEITKSKTNTIPLWSLIFLFMTCFIEILLLCSSCSAILRYSDSVTRIRLYNQLARVRHENQQIFGDILDHWSTTDDSEDDDQDDLDKIHKKDNLDDMNAAEQEMMEADLAAEAMEIAEMADMQEQDAEMDMAMNDVGND